MTAPWADSADLTVSECVQIRAYLLRARLPHPQPRADSPDRGNAAGRHLGGEHLGSPYPQRVRPGYSHGYMLCLGYTPIGLPGTADDRHEQLIRPDQGDRRPRGHGGAGRAVAQPVRHVRRQRRRDAQAEQPPASAGPGTSRRAASSSTIELA